MTLCPQPSLRRQVFQSEYTPYICASLFHYKPQEIPCCAALNGRSTESTSNSISIREWMARFPPQSARTLLYAIWQKRTCLKHSLLSWIPQATCLVTQILTLHRCHGAFMTHGALFPRVVLYLFKCHKFQVSMIFGGYITTHVWMYTYTEAHIHGHTGMVAHSKCNHRNDQSYHFYQVPGTVLIICTKHLIVFSHIGERQLSACRPHFTRESTVV